MKNNLIDHRSDEGSDFNKTVNIQKINDECDEDGPGEDGDEGGEGQQAEKESKADSEPN
jgi:hypothetical protein